MISKQSARYRDDELRFFLAQLKGINRVMRVIMPQKENNGFAKALTKFLTTILAPTVFNRNEQKKYFRSHYIIL